MPTNDGNEIPVYVVLLGLALILVLVFVLVLEPSSSKYELPIEDAAVTTEQVEPPALPYRSDGGVSTKGDANPHDSGPGEIVPHRDTKPVHCTYGRCTGDHVCWAAAVEMGLKLGEESCSTCQNGCCSEHKCPSLNSGQEW